MPPRRPIRVLVVEDSLDDEELVLLELQRGGYQVTHVRVDTDGAMREALEQSGWDIVLSDYSMPQFSGPEALALLKGMGLDVPFIIVSGTVGEDIAVSAMRSGANDYVLKGNLVRLCPAIERELREAEVRRSRRQAELAKRATEARFRAIMEAATDGVVSADSSGQIVYVNPAIEKLFGYSARELLGEPLSRLVPERFRETYLDELSEYASTRGNQGIGRTVEIVGRRKDGSEFPVDLSLGSWSTGGETFFAGIVRDIAERKKVEAQLLVADRMVSVGTLAAGVAHEINNPLAAVIGNLDISVRDVAELATQLGASGNVGELQEQLNDAREAAERVRSIVRDLKIFSRGEQEKRGPVDVVQVMESTLRMAWNEIRHRAKVVKAYGSVPLVDASESRLGQVFLNIVVNAAQAIEEGQADKNEIRVSTRVNAGGGVVIEIGDTGPGIPPHVMQRLFTPFLTTKPVGTGTGLGLSICHRIVTEMGGDISVSSEPGAGTVFQVTLPPARSAVEAPAPRVAAEAKPVRRGRILVVDDDPAIAKVVARTLASQHDVVAVDRARHALDLINSGERFDVVLCDLMMPEVTGADFHDELLRVAPEHASGVIFLTGGAFTPRARDFLNAVPNQRVEKPFDTRELQALINERMR